MIKSMNKSRLESSTTSRTVLSTKTRHVFEFQEV